MHPEEGCCLLEREQLHAPLVQVTIAALIGHTKNSVTWRYIHTLKAALIMAVDNIFSYIEGVLAGARFK